MDLKSFYKKIDVDSIKSKLPPLKIPKIKSRKIFKTSREDIAQQNQQISPSKTLSTTTSPITPKSLPGHSSFIDRTPTRISTVSSLMNVNEFIRDKKEQYQPTYKTASNFEEENCPDEFDTREPPTNGNTVGKFSDRCKKTYKDISEFKIKDIFVKKTVVRRTEIEVDLYARQYERDNYLEEQCLENELEEQGYAFQFKESRRRLSAGSMGTISPPDSVTSGVPSPIRSELAHLQQNSTPPLLGKRRNAIADVEPTRPKFRQRSASSGSNDELPSQRKPNKSNLWGVHEDSQSEHNSGSLWGLHENYQSEEKIEEEEHVQVHRTNESKLSKFKKSMEGIRGSLSLESVDEPHTTGKSRFGKFMKSSKGNVSEDPDNPSPCPENPGPSRMARFKKSIKGGFMERNNPIESADEQKETARNSDLSRFYQLKKSIKERKAMKASTEEQETTEKTNFTSKIDKFKKTMKDGIAEGFSADKPVPAPAESGDEQSSANKPAGESRIAKFKRTMKEGISEKNIPAESGDDQPGPPRATGPSRMARFKKSMRAGIAGSTSDIHVPTTDSGDEVSSSRNPKGISRMAKFKRSMKEKVVSAESGDEKPTESRMSRFKKSMKEGMNPDFDTNWNFKGIRNRFGGDDDGTASKPSKKNVQSQDSVEEQSDVEKKPWKLSNIHLRRTEPAEKSNDPATSSPEGKFSGIKMSINRLKTRKPAPQTSEDSENDQQKQPNEESPKQNMSTQLKAGLRRLRMKDRSLTFDEEGESEKPPKEPPQTMSRLQNWKKSIKIRRQNETAEDSGSEPPPLPTSSPPGRTSTLLRKLNHIRSRKEVSEDDGESGDPSQSVDQQKPKSKNFEKLEQARTKALQKVNAQVLKMKNFHGRSRESPSEGGSPEKPSRKKKSDISKPIPKVPSSHSFESQLSLDDDVDYPGRTFLRTVPRVEQDPPKIKTPKPAGIPSSNSVESALSYDNDDGENPEEDIPRVYLHQDNSDSNQEPTLIVAVTRRAPAIPTIKDPISRTRYQPPKTEWIPNKSSISSFLEMTPSPESSNQQLDSRGHRHVRKRSMDSNDSDSWIPENYRTKSCSSSTLTGLNKISESTEPWKVHHSIFSPPEKLYKTKSIDIFANSGGDGAFRDFDDEMKNVPVRRIIAASAESLNKSYGGSTDEDDDYDNSSRVTRFKNEPTKVDIETIRKASNSCDSTTESNKATRGSPIPLPCKKAAQIGNSQESLDANYDENEDLSSDEDDDDEVPSHAPSPPPSFSPPPPPLPLRKPPRLVPERNDSMVRLAHPLVKQGSLRRQEPIETSDLGKVNKLINRFEKTPPTYENVPRIQLIPSDDDYLDDTIAKLEEEKLTKTKENTAKKRSIQTPVIVTSDVVLKIVETPDNHGNGKKNRNGNTNEIGTSDEEGNYDRKKTTTTSNKRRPAPIPLPVIVPPNINPIKADTTNNNIQKETTTKTTSQDNRGPSASPEYPDNLDNVSIQSPNSVYGSPIGSICLSERISTSSVYGSPVGSAFPARTDQLRSHRRLSNRSSLRDDDTFYSFESDEENHFYSLGDSSDVRYVIEI